MDKKERKEERKEEKGKKERKEEKRKKRSCKELAKKERKETKRTLADCHKYFQLKLTQTDGLWDTPTASLQRAKNHTNECLGYNTKQSEGEPPVLQEFGGMMSTPSCYRSKVQSYPEWKHLMG